MSSLDGAHFPFRKTSPLSYTFSSAMHFNRVVLPLPDRPLRIRTSFSLISRLTSWKVNQISDFPRYARVRAVILITPMLTLRMAEPVPSSRLRVRPCIRRSESDMTSRILTVYDPIATCSDNKWVVSVDNLSPSSPLSSCKHPVPGLCLQSEIDVV